MPHYKQVEPVKYDRKKHNISFANAFNGVMLAYKTQPNFRFHILFFLMTTAASYLYRITFVEYLIIVVLSAFIISLEMMNTALEALGDEISGGEYRKLIGVTKDVSAGAVLIAVLFAIATGIIIFLPRLIALIMRA